MQPNNFHWNQLHAPCGSQNSAYTGAPGHNSGTAHWNSRCTTPRPSLCSCTTRKGVACSPGHWRTVGSSPRGPFGASGQSAGRCQSDYPVNHKIFIENRTKLNFPYIFEISNVSQKPVCKSGTERRPAAVWSLQCPATPPVHSRAEDLVVVVFDHCRRPTNRHLNHRSTTI